MLGLLTTGKLKLLPNDSDSCVINRFAELPTWPSFPKIEGVSFVKYMDHNKKLSVLYVRAYLSN